VDDSPNILGLRETIASLEARFLQLSEIDKQRQLIAQKITTELKAELEAKDCELLKAVSERDAKDCELLKAVSERDARANQAEEAQQAFEQLKQKLAVELKEKEEALNHAKYLMEQLEDKEAEARSVKEEAELTLLQLYQVQEELEHYVLLSRRQAEMLISSENLFTRTTKVALELT